MKTKPILFKAEMVRAILKGTKTQTRRIVKFNKTIDNPKIGFSAFTNDNQFEVRGIHENGQYGGSLFKLPFSKGNKMWVRETWQLINSYATKKQEYIYRADGNNDEQYIEDWQGWKPSIFMPKKACRLFLDITKVRIERLQNISEEDAKSEGVLSYDCEITKSTWYKDYLTKEKGYGHPDYDYPSVNTAKESFKTLWISINGEESWNENPYVFVYDFSKSKKPENFI